MITTLAVDDWVWNLLFNHPWIIGVLGLPIIVFSFFEGRLLYGSLAGGFTLFFGLFCVLYGFGGWNPVSALGSIIFSWGMSRKPVGFMGGVLIFLGAVMLLSALDGDNGLNVPTPEQESAATSSAP